MILPEDDEHPVRPDLPWFRHLTYTEVHSMQIGIAAAVMLYLAYRANVFTLGMFTLLVGIRAVIEKHRCKSRGSKLRHAFGLHDVMSEPWYASTSAIITGIILITAFGL